RRFPRPSSGRSPCTTTRPAPCSRHRSATRAQEARRTRHQLPWRMRMARRRFISAHPSPPTPRMATGFRRCPARAGSRCCASIARRSRSSTRRGVRARSSWSNRRLDEHRPPTLFAPALCAANLALLAWAATTHAQSVETGTVKLADSNIEYFSRGTGEGIVLLPGGTLTVGYLDGLADSLAKAGYRVVGINFRGSGKSTGSSKGVTLQTMADDVAGVVKTLKLGPVHMAGND